MGKTKDRAKDMLLYVKAQLKAKGVEEFIAADHDSDIYDMLEEYCDKNELPEGSWLFYYDLQDVLDLLEKEYDFLENYELEEEDEP